MISIRLKLCLAFFLTTAFTVVGMSVFVQWSFDRGFVEYINTQQLEKMEVLSERLAEKYQEQNSWAYFQGRPQNWYEFIWDQLGESSEMFVVPHRDVDKKREGNPSHASEPFSIDNVSRPPGPPRFPRNPPVGPPGRLFPSPPSSLFLLDDVKVLLAGRQLQHATAIKLQPITYEGRLLGYVGAYLPPVVADQQDLYFAEKQTQALMVIAVVVALLSLFIAWPLGLHLLRPVKKLAQGTRQLMQGRYDTRISVQSRDELEQLGENFNALAEALEANENARKQWVADISHELRTPLAVLKAHIEAIQDGVRHADAKTLEILQSKITQLTRLVGDLYELSLSDLGALSYQKEQTNIFELLQETVSAFNQAFESKNISLELSVDSYQPLMFGDPERLCQLFSNLAKNSLRYTDAGGMVSVEASVSNNEIIITFRDSSPGVEVDDIPKLFDRLYRVEASRNRSHGGAGLGLSICKNIVEAHQGVITARPSKLGGLEIEIRLPLGGSHYG